MGTEQQSIDAEIIEMYNDGYSVTAVAEAVYWSRNYVRGRLLANGIEIRPQSYYGINTLPYSKQREIIFWRERGLTLDEVAAKVGVARNIAGKYSRLHNVQVPTKTHCSNGHKMTPDNTVHAVRKDGRPYKRCRTCKKKAQTRWKATLEKNNQKDNE